MRAEEAEHVCCWMKLLHLSQPTRKAPTEAQCRSVLQPVHVKHHDHKRQNGHVFFWFHIEVINVKHYMCSRLLFRVCPDKYLICDAAEVAEAKKCVRAVSVYVIHKLRNLKKQLMKPHQRLLIGECVRGAVLQTLSGAVLQTLSTTYFLRLLSNGRMKNIPYCKSNLPHTCTIYL